MSQWLQKNTAILGTKDDWVMYKSGYETLLKKLIIVERGTNAYLDLDKIPIMEEINKTNKKQIVLSFNYQTVNSKYLIPHFISTENDFTVSIENIVLNKENIQILNKINYLREPKKNHPVYLYGDFPQLVSFYKKDNHVIVDNTNETNNGLIPIHLLELKDNLQFMSNLFNNGNILHLYIFNNDDSKTLLEFLKEHYESINFQQMNIYFYVGFFDTTNNYDLIDLILRLIELKFETKNVNVESVVFKPNSLNLYNPCLEKLINYVKNNRIKLKLYYFGTLFEHDFANNKI